MAETRAERNYCLDFIKGIACISVVFMHCEFPGTLGTLVQCVSRFCVPYFFMVSGYFSYYENGRSFPAARKIKHILIIIAASTVFYLLFAAAKYLFLGESISVSGKSVIFFLLFNKPFIIAGQLWFLFSLLYVYILYAITDKLKMQKIAYYLIPVLILVYISLAQGCHIIGVSVANMIYRNFLIEGLAFFMLGHLIHRYRERITEKLSNELLVTVIVLSTLLCIPERYAVGRDFGVNICTFPQVTAIFIFAVRNGNIGQNNILTKFGKKYSMLVYVIHPFVWQSLKIAYSKLGIDDSTAAQYLMPIMVLALTVMLSLIVEKLIAAVSNKNQKARV